MAKTLVIKNANFEANRLTKITFLNIACTGISFSKSEFIFSAVGDTATVNYTVTPSNTTDAIIWSSSNESVVIVSNGTLVVVGIGDAIITATCGNYNATCTVSVQIYADDVVFKVGRYITYPSNNMETDYASASSSKKSFCAYSETGNRFIGGSDFTPYPIHIPNGAKKIAVTSEGFGCFAMWFDTNSQSPTHKQYDLCVGGESRNFVDIVAFNYRVLEIPEGANAFTLSFHNVDNTYISSDVDTSGIKIQFLGE